MRSRIRCWLKVTVALIIPVGVSHLAAGGGGHVRDLPFEIRALVVQTFGTPAQQEQLVNEAWRAAAVRNGTPELYEVGRLHERALQSMLELAKHDPWRADALMEFIRLERATQQESGVASGN